MPVTPIEMQRITITSEPKQIYNEALCQIPAGLSPVIWNSEWLEGSLGDLIGPGVIYDERAAKKLNPVIANIEVDLFMAQPYT